MRLPENYFLKCAVGKIKNTEGSAMSVGLLAAHLLYRLYVRVHLSKWFTFSKFIVVCLSLCCRLLGLLVTVEAICSEGFRATILSTYTEVRAGQNARITTETLIAYSLGYRLGIFIHNSLFINFPLLITFLTNSRTLSIKTSR